MAAFVFPTVTPAILPRCSRTNLLARGRWQLPRLPFTILSILHNHTRRYTGGPVGNEQEGDEDKSLLTLAIETSCDDTCVAILEKSGPAARILFNRKITSDNRKYNGINPLIAVDSHGTNLSMLVQESLKSLPIIPTTTTSPRRNQSDRRLPDFVSVTRGPGMPNCLTIGLNTAKGLAIGWDVPLLAVHHMQAHALTPRLVKALTKPWLSPSSSPSSPPLSTSSPDPFHIINDSHNPPSSTPSPDDDKANENCDITINDPLSPSFPFLTLLVSGGHTQLVLSRSLTSHSILADTPDIAVGDMLDKVARAVLPARIRASTSDVMFGAALEKFAFPGAKKPPGYTFDGYTPPANRESEIEPWTNGERGWSISAPLSGSLQMEFNFTGLGGKIREYAATLSEDDIKGRRLLARAAMKVAFEHIASRIVFTLSERKKAAAVSEFAHLRLVKDLKFYKQKMTEAASSNRTSDTVRTLIISGGVACNQYLRYILRKTLDTRGFENVRLIIPPPAYCTDNAAMIAWAGMEMYEEGWRSPLDITPARRWSLDPEKTPSKMRYEKGRPLVGILDGGVYHNVDVKKSFNKWLDEKGLTVK